MINSLYLWLGSAVILYIGSIFLLNRIPHVTVKTIGWLSIKHITIQLDSTTVYIGKIRLRLNWFRGKESGLKLINVEIMDIDVKSFKKEKDKNTLEEEEEDLTIKPTRSIGSIRDTLNIRIPKRIYDFLLHYRIINQINIHLFRLSLYDESIDEKLSIFIDYSRIEAFVHLDGTAKIVISLLHSYLHHSENKISTGEVQTKLFRNVEFIITFDTALSCPRDDYNNIYCDPRNFKLSLSIGRLSIPLDKLTINRSETHESKPKSAINIARYLDEVQDGLSIFSQFEFKLEELALSYGEVGANVSNFVIVLSNELKYNSSSTPYSTPLPPENILKLHFYITSCKVYHRESKCFELPSATFTTFSNPIDLLKVTDSLINNSSINSDNNFINSDTSIMITSPTVDVYYDQSDIFFTYCDQQFFKRQKSKPSQESNSPFKFSSLLYKLKEVSLRVVVVDMKVLVHVPNPKDSLSVYNRNNKGNIIVTYSLMSFFHRFYTKNFNILMTNKKRTKRFSLNGLFRIKNLKAEAAGNSIQLSKVNVLAIYNICESNLSLKVSSKDFKIKSVNEVLFHLVKEFRNRSIIHANKRYTYLTGHQPVVCPIADSSEASQVYIQLFEIAPKFLSSFKVSITNIQADIVCQDGLPSYKIFDEKLGRDVDLGDFKRGVSLRLNDIVFKYKKQKEDIDLSIKSFQMFTASEYSTEYIEDFDHVEFQGSESEFTDMSSLNSALSMDHNEEDDEEGDNTSKKVKKVLNIKEISLGNRSTLETRDVNKLLLTIPEIDGRMDTFFLWCTIYAKTLVNYFAPTVERNCSKEEMHRLTGQIKLKLDISINSFSTVIRLPNNVDIMIELDSLAVKNVLNTQSAALKYARLYVVHPSTKLWARLLVIKEPLITYQKKESIGNSEITIVPAIVRLNIPHQFLFYTVIDNFMTLFKAINQLNHNFKNLSIGINDFDRLQPDVRTAPHFPRVNIKTKMFGLTIENDVFENELSYIYELGVIEQRERLKKFKEFEKRAAELRATADTSIEEKIKLTNAQPPFKKGTPHNSAPKYTSPLRQFFSESDGNLNGKQTHESDNSFKNTAKPLASYEEVEEKIRRAKENLDRSIGSTWVSKFKIFRAVKLQSWRKRCLRAWGEDAISPVITEKFDILDRVDGPYLLGAVFRDLDFLVHNCSITDIDQFLYDYGKKQPKLVYSILVPITYCIKSRSLYVFLKDYPLPLVSFPENHDLSKPTVNMYGDLIINEKLVYTKEEMRFIFVPFSPAATSDSFTDSFYSVFIPRTLTPVKFMIDFKCDLNTDRACMVSWSKSYGAALSAASSAFDNFTKPTIDDSPLGWWDKIALVLHGKINFNISNEFCLHIKSSANPYELVGKNAGFVFSWKNNVKLKINDTENMKELIVLESDDFVLAIPNYSVQERKTWSLFYDEMEEYVPDIDSESKKFNKRVMKLSSAEKVQWTLGIMLERNKSGSTTLSDDMERISEFKPHYDVIVTNPKFENHPDSYTDYRSDYIHVAISVKSKSALGNSHNAIYLTPLTFHYFFSWWNTLKNHTSLPVRSGDIFKTKVYDPSHVKMGPHLITLKYQLVLEPLTVSHMYMHSFTSKSEHEKVAFTGLKGKFSKFSMDLHQRKEMATYVNEKLNISNKVQHLKMNEGEINVHEADIRFVNAIFKDTSMRGHLASFLNGNEHDSVSSPSYSDSSTKFQNWLDNVDVFDNDFSWVDPDDFVELEVRGPLSPCPHIKVIPFCFSPKFSYVREYSLQKDGKYPFGHEESHDCLMGMAKPEETQAKILMKRIKSLQEDMKENQALLEKLQADGRVGDEKEISRVKLDLKVLEEKLEVVESLYDTFAMPDLANTTDSESVDLARTTSRSLSVYSSHGSIEAFGECVKTNSSVSQFHNRFIVHNLQLKWNNDLRDLFMEYIQRVGDRKSHVYYMSKRAVDLVESVINNQSEREEPTDIEEKAFKKEFKSGEEVINGFNDEIDDLDSPEQQAEYKYLIKLIHPQIQLVSSKTVDSCMIITSRDLEMRIIDVHLGRDNQILGDSVCNLVETRHGVLFKDSHIFVFNNKDSKLIHPELTYGKEDPTSNINWPPWVECEVCYDTSWARTQLVAERNSMALILKKPNFMFTENKAVNQSNEIIVQLAKIVINATSEQYSTMFYVITDLLVHGKTKRDEFLKRLDKIMSLSDSADFRGLDDRVRNLQFTIREYTNLLLKLDFKSIDVSKKEKEQLRILELELERSKVELNVLMKGLGSRYKATSTKQSSRFWNILADQVIWHMLDENREPFIDFALASSRYTRIDSLDGSNINKVEISMIQGFNLQEKAVYPELLRPYLEGKDVNSPEVKESIGKCVEQHPIIQMTWKMLDDVGGIAIIQSAKLAIQPLKVELDYRTAKAAFSYLFPDSDSQVENDILDDYEDEDDVDSEDSSVFSGNGRTSRNPFKNFIAKHRSSGSASRSSTETSVENEMVRSDTTSSRASSDEVSMASETREKVNQLLKPTKKDKYNEDGDDISIIISRSLKYSSIIDIEVTKFKLFVSFKAPKHLNILDVHKLTLTIPNLRYRNKIWSAEDFCLRVRKDIIKIILNHTGKILGNKFKYRKRNAHAEPLKQISDYASFMTIQDLQSEGRARDTSKTNVQENHHVHHHHHHHNLKKSRTLSSNAFAFEGFLNDITDDDEEESDTSAPVIPVEIQE
ncbi:mitochondrial protein from FMP27-domain-containing protein [Scheffersomyces coipomensis]|uniref:mitochondrial protein from FMP27-domain-containing protein n=1 Tax=Scheffersomyces coipomensis TaxID=1788519 RepID=UPI00315C5227